MRKRNRQKQAAEKPIRPTGLFIVALLDRFCEAVYNALKNGLFGRIFSCYSLEQAALEKSFAAKVTFKSNHAGKLFRKSREILSREYEQSFILRKLRELVKNLLATPLKSYGKLLLSFGIYTILIYFIKLLVPDFEKAGLSFIVIGGIICLCSIPLMFSNQSLAFSVGNNKTTKAIFSDVFDFREELYQIKTHKSRAVNNFLILLGMFMGLLTFIAEPLTILLSIGALIAFAVIVITPEIGVVSSLFVLPFFSFADNPTIALALLVIITAFGYLVKLIRGKRIIRFEFVDIVICAFILLIAFGGVFSAGQAASVRAANISCILMIGYFLISNLMRTEKWLSCCVYAIVSSGTVVAVIGILQYVFGAVDNRWLDTSYFPDITGRSTALFENANYLAVYLVAVFPLALYVSAVSKKGKAKLLSVISCLLILICTVLTWSRGAWIAIIVTALVFLLLRSKKTLRFIISILLIIPYAILILPRNIKTRFTSIGDLTDSSTMYRFYTWKGSLRMLDDYFWSGIGYGPEAYRAIYPEYAYAGIEAAAHSHSLFLQIFIGLGFGGLLIFILAMFLFAQKNFEYFKAPFNENSRLISAAAFSAVLGILIMGLFDYVWYNYRIFFIFWALIGISIATIRYGNREIEKKNLVKTPSGNSATLDIDFQE